MRRNYRGTQEIVGWATARARDGLHVSWTGNPSSFLTEAGLA